MFWTLAPNVLPIDITAFLQVLVRMGCDRPMAAEPFSAEPAAKPAPEWVRLAAQSLAAVFAGAGLVNRA